MTEEIIKGITETEGTEVKEQVQNSEETSEKSSDESLEQTDDFETIPEETYEIGQIFSDTYPPEAAIWCNSQGNCYIEEIDPLEDETEEGEKITIKRYRITQIAALTEEEKQEQFNREFFYTSLGYIRRKVNMSTGETKDFLSDLLPVISMGIQTGQTISIITYSLPDFAQEITTEYLETLQTVKNVTTEFIQECFLQLSNDFLPVSQLTQESEE